LILCPGAIRVAHDGGSDDHRCDQNSRRQHVSLLFSRRN
jgi:hypothetical protein